MNKKEYENLKSQIAGVDTKIDAKHKELRSQISGVDTKVDAKYKELKNQISGVDTKVDAKYKELKNQISGVDIKVKDLRGLFGQMMDFVSKRMDSMADKADFQKILYILDQQNREIRDYFQEHTMLVGQVNRHDRWIHQIAGDTGTQLDS